MTQIISIQNNKGGLGKTTLVTNLAGVLSKKYKVLIIDTDGQGNVALTFGVNPDELEYSLYDVLLDGATPQQAVITQEGVDILPSNSTMDFFDMEVLSNRDKFKEPFYILREKLYQFSQQYDYVLIDSPPTLGLIAGNILSFTDKVLIPFQAELYAVRGLIRLIRTIESFKEHHNSDLDILGVVGMMVDSRTNLHREMLLQAKEYADRNGITFFETPIPRSIRFASSVAYENKPATLSDENNPIIQAYYELTEEILEEIGNE